MGIFDVFSKNSSDVRHIKKQAQHALDKRALSADRMQSLSVLREIVSESVISMLKRFDFQYDKSIEDEQEKEWVYETLVKLGPGILPELTSYFPQTSSFSWPLKILGEIATGDLLRETVRTLCEQNSNQYVRDPSKKIQLLHFMGDHVDPLMAELLVPYLKDIDEGVRFTAVESLFHQGNETIALLPLFGLLTSEEEKSRRIKLRIIEGLAQKAWTLPKELQPTQEKMILELLPSVKIDAKRKLVL